MPAKNLTQKEIIQALSDAQKAGSVQLTGTREERREQLREMRRKDFIQEGYRIGQTSS
ncbi:hypothetical protein VRB95_00200 [Erwinia aphidicola]|mgnify:CR=1 FL=1|jgi:uncharacterized lipoprotein YajG|uniref:hypothetical protein n=1 Tax=Erwinia TaxID=551 RepID=UPI001654BAA0|nr:MULTISPECIES: hypothetical protein [Erwinia]MBD1377679.1 hypothetical protein [Erwinia aphidicola]MBN1084097.1 hypothetical protein [Erwinia aphidicola]MDI3440782.1 hypothetical protein [Erwinia sp. V90_4]CAH0242929.1 hypothetical protein SRABI13_02750 [Erwinia aphidicola]